MHHVLHGGFFGFTAGHLGCVRKTQWAGKMFSGGVGLSKNVAANQPTGWPATGSHSAGPPGQRHNQKPDRHWDSRNSIQATQLNQFSAKIVSFPAVSFLKHDALFPVAA